MSGDEIVPLLDVENIEEARSQFFDASNTCQLSPILHRGLPTGKKYHIFISYSSHDQPYVLRLKNVLEGLGFKCMLADHDFSYGVSVMQNIETTLQNCHKLLLVVSQHFLRSPMCDKEVDMAHKYAADIGRNDFMIVLRMDESSLPLKIGYMTYINGVNLEAKDVGRKIREAFDGFAVVQPSRNRNGSEIIRKQPTENSSAWCCNSSYEFTDLTATDLNELISLSIEDSQACYQEMMEEANNHFLLKRYAIFVCGCKLTCFCLLAVFGIVTLFGSLYVLLTILTGTHTDVFVLYFIAMLTAALTISLHIGWTVYLFRQVMTRLYSIVLKNTDCKSQNYFVIPRQQRNAIFNYLEERARGCWPHDSEESIVKKCQEELLTTILSSFTGFDLSLIPKAISIRHSTYNKSCCLCQLAKSPWTYPNYDVIPTQVIDGNQDEETCVMKIAESETEDETCVKTFQIESENFELPEEINETSTLKVLCTTQETNSSDRPYTEAVSGSHLTEIANRLPLPRAEGGTSLNGAESTVFGSNIDQWYGDMCETRVRGEATSEQQPQVSQELITLRKYPVSLADIEMSTSLNDPREAVTLHQEDEEMQCFRGEYFIDESTHAKVPL